MSKTIFFILDSFKLYDYKKLYGKLEHIFCYSYIDTEEAKVAICYNNGGVDKNAKITDYNGDDSDDIGFDERRYINVE